MARPQAPKTQPHVLSFNSTLESFKSMDKTSLDSQRVRQNEERLLAERKRAYQRRKASSSDCPSSFCTDMSSSRAVNGSTSSSCSYIIAKGNDRQLQLADSLAAVQHPADEACGGSFSLEKPVIKADVHGLHDFHSSGHGRDPCPGHGCLDVRTGVAREIAEPKHNPAQVSTRVSNDSLASLNLQPQPPDAAAGGAAKVASPLSSTWCVMDEYEVQPLARTQSLVAGLSPLGRKWMPDTPQCAICTARFGPFTRRHHCRKCGRNVCNACSPFRVHLRTPLAHPSKDETGPHRVCMGCHEPC